MTKAEMLILHDTLEAIIKNSDICQSCAFCTCDNVCFFASQCLTNNFSFYKGEPICITEKKT